MEINAAEFISKCSKILDQVQTTHREVIITKRGKPIAKIVHIEQSNQADPMIGALSGAGKTIGDLTEPVVDPMKFANISEAKAQLSSLIEKMLSGEEVIIGKAGKPVTRLIKYENYKRERRPSALKGQIKIADDFDELPEDISKAFGME